jgi:hypothetical protein
MPAASWSYRRQPETEKKKAKPKEKKICRERSRSINEKERKPKLVLHLFFFRSPSVTPPAQERNKEGDLSDPLIFHITGDDEHSKISGTVPEYNL